MKLIMHIGMGKTGTSSIQNALSASNHHFIEQNVKYMGMWFDVIDPRYHGHKGLIDLTLLEEEEQKEAALQFSNSLRRIHEGTGAEKFILSNEGIWASVNSLKPFLKTLQTEIDIHLVAFIRDPYTWLPSAFTQWGLIHKQQLGPLQSFRERGEVLIGQYSAFADWIDHFEDNLTLHTHHTHTDVVAEFASICEIEMSEINTRSLERTEPAETILRAAFNNRYHQEVLPDLFNRAILNTKNNVPKIAELAKLSFDYEGIDEIIQSRQDLFDAISKKLADFKLQDTPKAKQFPEPMALQERLIDYLVQISFRQADRITQLEKDVQALKAKS